MVCKSWRMDECSRLHVARHSVDLAPTIIHHVEERLKTPAWSNINNPWRCGDIREVKVGGTRHKSWELLNAARSTPEQREKYKFALRNALTSGHNVLMTGGTAMQAAVRAVVSMEGKFSSLVSGVIILRHVSDCPLFNCAKGAVFNVAGKVNLPWQFVPT